ncbi:hypothetical protein H1R20_g16409, partial [Candolleomyces eurysporus]
MTFRRLQAVSRPCPRVLLKTQELLPHGTEFLEATRAFLSNSRNIWTVTALFELLTIIYTVVPWKYAQLPLSAKGESTLSLPYPPASVFQTSTFWLVLLHWALPTLVIPSFIGNLISFNPSAPPQEPTQPVILFDPLTAAIARLAVSAAYPYASLSATEHVHGLDVLGYNLRFFNALVGLGFAFAEAIAGAPRLFAKTLLFSRLFTSVLNQALVRLASPSAFGTASIQFELVLSTILFLSREGVRNAILRSKTAGKEDGEGDERVKQLNLTFIPALLGVPLAVGTTLVYLAFASEEVRRQPYLTVAVALYAGAAVVELLSEPMHNRAMLELKTNVRVRAEGLGITAKSFVTFLVLFVDARRGQDTLALVAFALGQLAYSVVVFGHYARTFGVPWVKKPKAAQSGYFDSALLNLSVTMTFQSVIKHVLTEGDKLLLTFFSPLEDQGGYAIAANYGSSSISRRFIPCNNIPHLPPRIPPRSDSIPTSRRNASSLLLQTPYVAKKSKIINKLQTP